MMLLFTLLACPATDSDVPTALDAEPTMIQPCQPQDCYYECDEDVGGVRVCREVHFNRQTGRFWK